MNEGMKEKFDLTDRDQIFELAGEIQTLADLADFAGTS